MKNRNFKITTTKYELTEGLFGQVILYVFEILPYLFSKAIYPEWDIKSELYGSESDNIVIPGVFDIAYTPVEKQLKEIKLSRIRKNHLSVLGNDWMYLNKLWHSYFLIPSRIIKKADEAGDLSNSLGIHYRGTDKRTADWDTNPVTHEDYMLLIEDFLSWRGDINSIFIATDEFEFVNKMSNHFTSYKIINLGEVGFHKNIDNVHNKADRAVLDCLLLSRCKYLLQTSSALSGFAKVLNPDLESYRISASKFFTDIPYFPIAYIPVLTSNDINCNRILDRLLKDDWLKSAKANKKFNKSFCTKKRYKGQIILQKFLHLKMKFKKKIFKLFGYSQINRPN
jgi:hypothetical protein